MPVALAAETAADLAEPLDRERRPAFLQAVAERIEARPRPGPARFTGSAASFSGSISTHRKIRESRTPPADGQRAKARGRAGCRRKADRVAQSMGDHAHTLSDFLVPTLSIECEPCGRFGRYNVARLMQLDGDAKLPELRHVLANCPKARSFSIYDQCKVRYGKDSRF
jgi:hypothetical protein